MRCRENLFARLHWRYPFDVERIVGQELEGLLRALLSSSFPGLQEAFVLEGVWPRH